MQHLGCADLTSSPASVGRARMSGSLARRRSPHLPSAISESAKTCRRRTRFIRGVTRAATSVARCFSAKKRFERPRVQ